MNETLPANIKKKFEHTYDLDRKTLLEKVYRQKQPAVFLSSFAEFYLDNKEDNYLKNVIITGFNKLINTYLLPLHKQHPGATVNFAGSVAANFQDYLYRSRLGHKYYNCKYYKRTYKQFINVLFK